MGFGVASEFQLAAEPIALSMQTAQASHCDFLTPTSRSATQPAPLLLLCPVLWVIITGVGSSLWLAYFSVYLEIYEEFQLVLL